MSSLPNAIFVSYYFHQPVYVCFHHEQCSFTFHNLANIVSINCSENFEILQLQAKLHTVMVLWSRFVWITNSSHHRRVWTANILHTKKLPTPTRPWGLGWANPEYPNSLPYESSSWFMLRYFNFEPIFLLQWCPPRDLFGSQILLTTGRFELWITCIQISSLAH